MISYHLKPLCQVNFLIIQNYQIQCIDSKLIFIVFLFTIMNTWLHAYSEIKMTEIEEPAFIADNTTSAARPATNPLTTRHGSYSYHSVAIS